MLKLHQTAKLYLVRFTQLIYLQSNTSFQLVKPSKNMTKWHRSYYICYSLTISIKMSILLMISGLVGHSIKQARKLRRHDIHYLSNIILLNGLF